jgi:tetratricopeptide (TPR) repeat protein
MTAADLAKKEKQKMKVDGVVKKCDDRKAKAAELFKLGQYGDATKQYKGAIDVLESAIEDFPLFKEELISIEAAIFNNLAACCHKELNSKSEIEYTTKVIDRQQYLSDSSVLLKAYLRRGLAYEQ